MYELVKIWPMVITLVGLFMIGIMRFAKIIFENYCFFTYFVMENVELESPET